MGWEQTEEKSALPQDLVREECTVQTTDGAHGGKRSSSYRVNSGDEEDWGREMTKQGR